jgi:hypothetical protein
MQGTRFRKVLRQPIKNTMACIDTTARVPSEQWSRKVLHPTTCKHPGSSSSRDSRQISRAVMFYYSLLSLRYIVSCMLSPLARCPPVNITNGATTCEPLFSLTGNTRHILWDAAGITGDLPDFPRVYSVKTSVMSARSSVEGNIQARSLLGYTRTTWRFDEPLQSTFILQKPTH